MNKSKFKKNFIFIVVVLVLCIAIYFGYNLFTGKENPLSGLINQIVPESKKVTDTYNGVYSYKESLNGTKVFYTGCSAAEMNNYILIVNDEYYLFRSSCLGTFLKGSGNIEDLEIKLNENKNLYEVKYNDIVYDKDPSVLNIVIANNVKDKLSAIGLDTYQMLLKESESEGDYFDIDSKKISGINTKMVMSIKKEENSSNFTVSISNHGTENVIYSYSGEIDDLPDLTAYGNSIVAIEKESSEDGTKYAYNFKVMTVDGIIYDLDKMFPIKVDDVELNTSDSIYVTFDSASRNYKMFVGYDKNFCDNDYTEEDGNEIAYYEFDLKYDYSIYSFDKPEFVKIGYKSEGCKYINSYLGR